MLPLVLLFWPFAQWSGAISLLLRVLPAVSAQLLLCRLGRCRALPLLLTGLFALWGTYLFCTSPSWRHATVTGLTADYISPFFGCIAAYWLGGSYGSHDFH
ncbi:MAG: hypothetical protein IJ452_02560 [Butyricicoccus sp.]|nr:hypothetical protein [Butyricicoccus sp.]MBQ8585149.1 hypothetical protein [Butyricicoccus sp.]